MHEVSIMQSALDVALEHATRQGATKIHQIKLCVGESSGVVSEALEFAFDVVVEGTIAQGAKLEVDYLPVVCYCPACNLEFQPTDLFYECPQCHQISTSVLRGNLLELVSLEVS